MIKNRRSVGFKDHFKRLPKHIQQIAIGEYARFCEDPNAEGLRTHLLSDLRVKGTSEDVRFLSVSIAFRYKAVALVRKETMTNIWFFIGTHAEYDRQFRKGSTVTLPLR